MRHLRTSRPSVLRELLPYVAVTVLAAAVSYPYFAASPGDNPAWCSAAAFALIVGFALPFGYMAMMWPARMARELGKRRRWHINLLCWLTIPTCGVSWLAALLAAAE